MVKFKDDIRELIGTRQKRWLDYLWYYNNLEPFRVCREFGSKKYSKWQTIKEATYPIDHREILNFEKVAEFDSVDIERNYKLARIIYTFLNAAGIPAYVQDHCGRSPHIHFFINSLKRDDADLLIERLPGIDLLKWNSSGMCRAIGGAYRKKAPEVYYASFFPEVVRTTPILNRSSVRFPSIDLDEVTK